MGRPFDLVLTTGGASASPLADVFRFTAGPLPSTLTFAPSQAAWPCSRKRARPLNDVDGEFSSHRRKKKRRLRLFLITSRLSPVFSQPATYIVDRGSSKIAVWAKQKALGRNLLRKAAILNCIRQRERLRQELQQVRQVQQVLPQQQLEMARQTFLYGSYDTRTHPVVCSPNAPFPVDRHPPPNPSALVRGPYLHHQHDRSKADDCSSAFSRKSYPSTLSPNIPTAQVPRRDYIPLPPSPLGLSNYDALDLDDFPVDNEDDYDGGSDDGGGTDWNASLRRHARDLSASPPAIYSDFNVLDPMEAVVDDYDLIEAFAGTSTTAGVGALEEVRNEAERRRELERRRNAEERMAEINAEKERQKVLFSALPVLF